MAFLTESERRAVFSNVLNVVNKKFMGSAPPIAKLRETHESQIVHGDTSEQFEEAVSQMLRQLGTSHTGFFHQSRPRAAGRIAMAATLMKAETPEGLRWVFQNVHPGGVAAEAGIRSGDVLLKIDEKDLAPPDAIPFVLGQSYVLTGQLSSLIGSSRHRSCPRASG